MIRTLLLFLLASAAFSFVSAALYEDEPKAIGLRSGRTFAYLTLGVIGFGLFIQFLGAFVL